MIRQPSDETLREQKPYYSDTLMYTKLSVTNCKMRLQGGPKNRLFGRHLKLIDFRWIVTKGNENPNENENENCDDVKQIRMQQCAWNLLDIFKNSFCPNFKALTKPSLYYVNSALTHENFKSKSPKVSYLFPHQNFVCLV